MLRPEFDAGGYDLVMNRGNIERHIQFKTSLVHGKAADIKASLKLMTKPGGCVIWILVTPELVLHSDRWLEGAPGERLPDMLSMKVAKHTKGNAGGEKGKRPGHRIIPVSQFDPPCSLNKILERLFGWLA